MSRGSQGQGTRGGRIARSENTALRAIMSQKSPAVKLIGNLVKSKAFSEVNGRPVEGDDLPPTQELVEMVNKDLGDAEKVISNAQVEHSAVYNDEGKQVLVKTSHTQSAVYLTPKEMKAMKGNIFTHNHPLYGGESLPFSRADVTLLHFTKAKEFRAVAGNTVFSISPPKDSKFWKMKEPAIDKLLDKAREVAFAKLGRFDEDARINATPKELAIALDDMLKMVDRQINLGYKRQTL